MPANDQHRTFVRDLTTPPEHAAAVVTSDSADLANVSRAIFVGGAGNLTVVMAGGETVTLSGVAAGSLLPIRVSRVMATGTSATSIVTLW